MVVDRARQRQSAEPIPERAYYSISQAAALLGVSRVTIWRWLRDGRLRANRLGHRTIRISRDDLEQALTQTRSRSSRSWGVREAAREPAAKPPESEHIVQFYETDAFLLKVVFDYLGEALRGGHAAIVIATAAHCEGIDERLAAAGIDLDAARASGQYISLDAADTLSSLMVDGMPDRDRFDAVIGGLIRSAGEDFGGVRGFGEMVALLALAGSYDAATLLEALWTDLAKFLSFGLLCAYPMDRLDGEAAGAMLGDVCALHTRVVAAESISRLSDADGQQRAIAVLQQKAASLEAEIAERKRAVQVRDEFMAIASHELRTPLTTVRALSQLMLRRLDRCGTLDPKAAGQSFRVISDQASKLTRLAEQLLDVTRLEAGRLSMDVQSTDLIELARRVAAEAALRSSREIVVQSPEPVVATVDPLRIDQVLTNLLENAVKYGSKDQPIEVELRRPEGLVEIAVRDHGPGIPEAARAGIFERFFQAHADSHQSGLGLGLFISRQIVELHGGTISAEFPLDGGTRVVIRLPG